MATIYDSTLELLDFSDLVKYTIDQSPYVYDGIVQQVNAELRAYPSLTPNEAWEQACVRILETNGLNVERNASGGWTASVFSNTKQVTDVANQLNSNSTVIKRGNFREMYGNIKQFDGANQYMQISRYPVSGGLGTKASYVIGSVGSAISAVSTGIFLGKTIASALYNNDPNYWRSIGLSSLDPETWGILTNDSDSPFAGLFNFILGVDGENGTAKAYMNQDALAYMALALKNAGWFSTGGGYTIPDTSILPSYNNGAYSLPVAAFPINSLVTTLRTDSTNYYEYQCSDSNALCVLVLDTWNQSDPFAYEIWAFSKDTTATFKTKWSGSSSWRSVTARTRTFNGKTFRYAAFSSSTMNPNANGYSPNFTDFLVANTSGADSDEIGYIVMYGTEESSAPDGVGNQTGATMPDTSTWNDVPSTLQSLQNQYPDAFNNPMVWNTDSPYDETGGNQTTYIPVPFPMATSSTDTMPTSGTQTQTSLDLSTLPQDIVDLLTKTVQQTAPDTSTPPSNPTDTGTGSSPTPTAPTGSASALWSVYHPTQAQINSFGAWLWGSPFLTDIGKLFQNPIDGVISLHKVYASPVDSGTGTIVVGTLDSHVSSATVNQQYIEVDCGSVDCYEDFGNVFDYSPYTKVSLYLPFIGIVPLNVSDVMRSTIHVIYGVDVFTGACIAMVEVSRDGNAINLYQYTGNCAVHYPLSNVQQSQLLSGLISIAAGVGSVLATGGVAAPAAVGIASGVVSAGHTSIGRSGGFSANAGAMGIKVPYLILERPQTKVAPDFTTLTGYPTNASGPLGSFSGQVKVTHVHIEGVSATESELQEIDKLLKSGVIV